MAYKDSVKGKSRLGIGAYAEALLIIPKVLATNSGFDAQVCNEFESLLPERKVIPRVRKNRSRFRLSVVSNIVLKLWFMNPL